MRTVAVIQARVGSTRLPGKVLSDIAGRPMVAHVIDRARLIAAVDEVVVAIPDLPEDDPLVDVVVRSGSRVVRGSAKDVLDRYVAAVRVTAADRIVRITADCPLLPLRVSSLVLAAHRLDEVEYASNTIERTFPRGLDTEVISADALMAAWREAAEPADREHVTRFIWRQPDRFRLASVRGEADRSHLRWTVDEQADLQLVRTVYADLGDRPFEMEDVLALLDRRPELLEVNAAVSQKQAP